MSQDVERLIGKEVRDREPRQARLAGLAIGSALLLLNLVSPVSAGDGDVPDLAKPNEMPAIVSTPTTPLPTPTRPTTPPAGRAVLALPGLNRPAAPKTGVKPPPVTSSPSITPAPDGLMLDAPLEMNAAPSTVTPLPRVAPAPAPGRSPRPLVLDSPDDEPVPIDKPGTRSNPSTKPPTTAPRVDPQPAPSTQRRGRFFGLLPAPAAAPTPSVSTGGGSSMPGKTSLPGRSVVEGSLGDAAAESALKRRIEKQARDAVGDRARSIDVRVVGKAAVVQVRGVKLLQKRGVRKSLEAMPALSGLRSTIEVID